MKAAFDEARGAATETNDEPAEADSYEVVTHNFFRKLTTA